MTAAAVLDDDRPAPSLPETAEGAAPAQPSASDRLRALAIAAIDRLAGAAAEKVEEVADRLGDMAADAAKGAIGKAGLGVGATAALEAGKAKLEGKNPVWAGIKGGVGAMSTGQKVLLGLALLLTAVLSPVALIVLALVLIIAAIVGAVTG
jgi:hypothetical protein